MGLLIERPPGPKGRRLVGNSYDYDQDRIGFLRRCQAEYGDVFSFSPSTVVVCHPDLIDELLKQTNEVFLAEQTPLASGADGRRLVAGIDRWMRSRSVAWRGMTRQVVRSHGRRVVAMLGEMLRPLVGRDFNVEPVMRRYSARLVADFCFGPGSDDVVEVTDLRFSLAAPFVNSNLTFPTWLPLPSVRRAVRAEDRVRETIRRQIRRRRAHPNADPEDLLDVILADTESGLTEDEVVALLGGTMLASFGPPGSAMTWLLLEMDRNPDGLRRLRQEAMASIAETGGVEDDRRLPYSQAFAKEVLRLHPPTWLLGRVVRRACVLGGWSLEPGMSVTFSPYLLHRDPRWWPDPDEFRPERWLGSPKTQHPNTYLPFGAGPRFCLGAHLGRYQMVTCAAHLAANYILMSDAAGDPSPAADAVLLPTSFRARVDPATTRTGEPDSRLTGVGREQGA